MSRVVLLTITVGLALSAALALFWPADPAPQDAGPARAAAPDAAPSPELEAQADGPDGPRLESGVPLERRLARRAARLGIAGHGAPSTIAQLARSRGWTCFLKVWLHLPAEPDAAAQLERLALALGLATDPVVRQNLIFLAGLALPAEVATPWLEALRTGADPGDAEDALLALAQRGDPAALAAFERLAGTPSGFDARQLIDGHEIHDALGEASGAEARERLRSYRAIEVRIADPYFKLTAYLASGTWGGQEYGALLRWQPKVVLGRAAEVRLLEAWLARYPGHPGSDNVALWIGRRYALDGDQLEAARWYSRAAVFPDQDRALEALILLTGTYELLLSPEQVQRLSAEDGVSTPNRAFATYVWLRRLAAERGPDEGLRAWAVAAAQDPAGDLGVAWARRFAIAPPTGLDSGLRPLAPDDPLRRVDTGAGPTFAPRDPRSWNGAEYGPSTGRWGSDAERLHPWPEPMRLDRPRLERQARAWETLAELERRAERARGDTQADLLYKQAAVLYHDRDVYYPAYGGHSMAFRANLSRTSGGELDPAWRRAVVEPGAHFERTSFAWRRALELFQRLERDHPRWPGSEKVIFSQALSWRRLVDYRPHHAWMPAPEDDREKRRSEAAQQAVACFERLISLHHESTLVPDARAAVAWWRKQRGAMLR